MGIGLVAIGLVAIGLVVIGLVAIGRPTELFCEDCAYPASYMVGLKVASILYVT